MEQSLKKQLKAKAHHLKPVVLIGEKGLTESVLLEIERALLAHELIKIRISAETKEARLQMIHKICKEREAECVNMIGHITIIYRHSALLNSGVCKTHSNAANSREK